MIGESRPNILVEKKAEVIVLDGDDEIPCIVLDETVKDPVDDVIDLDESEVIIVPPDTEVSLTPGKCKASAEVICINTVTNNIGSSSNNSLWKEHKENLLKQSDRKGRKRKYPFSVEKEELFETVDLIGSNESFTNISQGSFQKSNQSGITVNIREDRRKVSLSQESSKTENSIYSQCTSESVSPKTSRINRKRSNEEHSKSSSTITSNSLTSEIPTKVTRLSYKRLAHLTPLATQQSKNASSSVSTSTNLNIYNPNADLMEKKSGLRPIVIDGNNVAISHGKGTFSLKGIQICINYFEKRGHKKIKAFIPQYRKNRETHDMIHQLERQGKVAITPSRRVDGKLVASYDDRYIVQYAAEFGGVIVSTDNFRDLLAENKDWKDTIQNRLLMFTWADDLLMFPQDPLGRHGPRLDEFLRFPDS